jgi:hypothetical protein
VAAIWQVIDREDLVAATIRVRGLTRRATHLENTDVNADGASDLRVSMS